MPPGRAVPDLPSVWATCACHSSAASAAVEIAANHEAQRIAIRIRIGFLLSVGVAGSPSRSVEGLDRDRVEVGYAVCLGPQRDLAGVAKCRIACRKQLLAVIGDREAVAFGPQRQRVP